MYTYKHLAWYYKVLIHLIGVFGLLWAPINIPIMIGYIIALRIQGRKYESQIVFKYAIASVRFWLTHDLKSYCIEIEQAGDICQ